MGRVPALGGGELLASGEVILDHDAEYTSPWIYAAYSGRGLDGISAAFHGWLRSRPHHPGPDRPRPVILNTWEAVYFDHDLDRLRRLADVAAQIGVERFVLDDAWFRGRRDDTAGLGDWFVDEAVWPEGLDPIVHHVRGLGMQFGLWVEPEMINPDSDLYRAHPDWVLGPRGRPLPPTRRHQHVLDLARTEAYDYVLERLDALLTDYDIAYLKWDHNRDLVDADHDGRAGVHAQTRAVYRLLGELRTFLPPELIGAHVGPPHSHTTGRTHGLSFRVATALFGHFGIEWDIAAATDEDRAALSQAIAFYKAARGLLHTGTVVHADHPDPHAWVHGVVAADGSRALYCLAQLTTSQWSVPPPVRLPGLDHERRYRVRVTAPAGGAHTVARTVPPWTAGDGIVLAGRVISAVGLPSPVLSPEQAVLISVEAAAGDSGP